MSLRESRNRAMSPTAARNVAAGSVHARHGQKPLRLGPVEHLPGDGPLGLLDLYLNEIDLPQRRGERLGFFDRKLLLQLREPAAAFDSEHNRARRLALQRAHHRAVHLVLRPGAGADQLLATRKAPAQHAHPIIRVHTASSSPFHSKVASVRASILSVFARACAVPVSSGETTTTRWQRPSNRLATSHAELETSITTRSVGSRLPANASIPSAVIATRPPPCVCPDSQIAISQNSRCRSRPIARPSHVCTCCTFGTTNHLPDGVTRDGERAGERQRPIRARGTPGRVAGAARMTSPRSQRIVQHGLPICVLHNKNPCAR
jgi:hypothetical protein